MKKIINFISGKGGVGKSVISVNLANILSKAGYKILLIDGNFLTPDLDAITKQNPSKTIFNFLSDDSQFSAILHEISPNFAMIFNEPYRDDIPLDKLTVFKEILSQDESFDFILIDNASNPQNNYFLDISDEILAICGDEPSAIVDSYHAIKRASVTNSDISLILNYTSRDQEAKKIAKHLQEVVKNNVSNNISLKYLGDIKHSKIIYESTKKRELFTNYDPKCTASFDINKIASQMLVNFGKEALKLQGFDPFGLLVRKIGDKF